MVAFDASFLILVFDDAAPAKHGTPRLQERIDLLLAELQKSKTRILIPTPALSEFLTKADISLLQEITDSQAFRIVSFDIRAAIEAAEMTKQSVKESDKKDPVQGATWSKIKFDRQIVAIAKVEGATSIYSTDPDIAKHAKQVGILCFGIPNLPIPPSIQPFLPGVIPDESGKQSEKQPAEPSPEKLLLSDGGPAQAQGQAATEASKIGAVGAGPTPSPEAKGQNSGPKATNQPTGEKEKPKP